MAVTAASPPPRTATAYDVCGVRADDGCREIIFLSEESDRVAAMLAFEGSRSTKDRVLTLAGSMGSSKVTAIVTLTETPVALFPGFLF